MNSTTGTVHRMARTAASAVMLFGCLVPGSIQAAPDVAASTAAIEAAMKFRSEFGLRADPDYVRERSVLDRVSQEWGVPLTIAEEAEMDRRSDLANRMDAFNDYARTIPELGGVFFDQQEGGEIVVAIAGDPEPYRLEIARRIPPGATFRLEHVAHSVAELTATHNKIVADRAALSTSGVAITSVTTDESGNVVIVGVSKIDDQVAAVLTDRYGSAVQVQQSGDPTLTHTGCYSRTHCYGPPLRAGISVNPSGCSLAFVVNVVGGVRRILTAGHHPCGDFAGSASHDGFTFGSIQSRSWFGTDTWETADAATIGNLTSAQDDNLLYTCAGCAVAISGSQSEFENENIPVCLSAFNPPDAVRCGTMINKNVSICYIGLGCLRQQREATYAVFSGDSGGAAYSGSTAYGVQSSCIDRTGDGICTFGNTLDNALYSHIAFVLVDLNASIYTGN